MGITEQDKKIADVIVENRKACIVVVNKWDLFAEEVREAREEEISGAKKGTHRRPGQRMTTLGEFGEWVQEKLFFLDYAPVIFTRPNPAFIWTACSKPCATSPRSCSKNSDGDFEPHAARRRRTPPADQRAGHRLKFFYATQVRQAPPTFLLFVNRDELFSDQYKKYLAGEMRAAFGYEGCPIVLVPKARPKTIEPMRKFKPAHQKSPGRMDAPRAPGTTDIPAKLANRKKKNRAERLFTAANKSLTQTKMRPGSKRKIALISFGNIVRVTFLQNFLETTTGGSKMVARD
jgi:hypothetical protein